MLSCRPVSTPMITNTAELSESTELQVDKTLLPRNDRLAFIPRNKNEARHSSSRLNTGAVQLKSHATPFSVKRIMRYLNGTKEHVLHLRCSEEPLVGYSDSDWGGDRMNRKSRSGTLLMLGGNSVSWRSLKQHIVALSTSEAEFISASEVTKKIYGFVTF